MSENIQIIVIQLLKQTHNIVTLITFPTGFLQG